MIGLHNLTLDELRGEIDHQDNELAKVVFDQAIPEAEEQGRQAGINEVLRKIAPVGDLLENAMETIDALSQYIRSVELDHLLNIQAMVESAMAHIESAEGIE